MCPGSSQQRDFAALFRYRRCISTLVGIFRFKRGFVSLCVRAAVSSAILPLCSVADGAFLPWSASSGLNAAWGVMCPGSSQQRDFAALFRYRRCISSSGGIFRFKAVCVVMCSGGGQQRDFATLFRYRRCASSSGGIFRFKRGFVSLCVWAAVSSAISPLCSVADGAFLPWSASSDLNTAWGVICQNGCCIFVA